MKHSGCFKVGIHLYSRNNEKTRLCYKEVPFFQLVLLSRLLTQILHKLISMHSGHLIFWMCVVILVLLSTRVEPPCIQVLVSFVK